MLAEWCMYRFYGEVRVYVWIFGSIDLGCVCVGVCGCGWVWEGVCACDNYLVLSIVKCLEKCVSLFYSVSWFMNYKRLLRCFSTEWYSITNGDYSLKLFHFYSYSRLPSANDITSWQHLLSFRSFLYRLGMLHDGKTVRGQLSIQTLCKNWPMQTRICRRCEFLEL